MAGKNRAETPDLMDWAGRAEEFRRAGMFPLVRLAEATERHKPRVGKARRPEQSIVDLAQIPTMGFSAATLENVEYRYGRPQLRGYWLGLTGPMGPLPSHLTEFAMYERRYAKKRPFGDWLDLISSRMLQLFYRAWAESQPAAHADRSDDDNFVRWVAALTGGMEGVDENASFFARARIHYAGLFGGSRSAIALQDSLSNLLLQPVQVEEFLPRWRKLERDDQSRLGHSFAVLGQDAMLGQSVFSASDAFRVRVEAENWRDYLSLMPGGGRFAVAAEAIEAFKPTHLEWSLYIAVDEDEAPPVRLDGRSRLGWHSWMKRGGGPRETTGKRKPKKRGTAAGKLRADAHLTMASIARRTTAS